MNALSKYWQAHRTKTLGVLGVVAYYLHDHVEIVHDWIKNNDHSGKIIGLLGLLTMILGFYNGQKKDAPPDN